MSNQLNNKGDWMGNRLEPLTGFSWEAGQDRITTGIVVWSDIFLHQKATGEKLAIVLMDTQGMFDKQSLDEDYQIFALATWLSSIQIANVKIRIGEDQLQRLQVI